MRLRLSGFEILCPLFLCNSNIWRFPKCLHCFLYTNEVVPQHIWIGAKKRRKTIRELQLIYSHNPPIKFMYFPNITKGIKVLSRAMIPPFLFQFTSSKNMPMSLSIWRNIPADWTCIEKHFSFKSPLGWRSLHWRVNIFVHRYINPGLFMSKMFFLLVRIGVLQIDIFSCYYCIILFSFWI